MKKIEAAFIFVTPETDPKIHRCEIGTGVLNLHVVGVSSYAEGAEVAKKLADLGVEAIELCAGFGVEGTAAIAAAVKGFQRAAPCHVDINQFV